MIELSFDVAFLLETLNAAGHDAYVVGGCVRDALLGREPKDWDITTSALPEQVKACFAGYPILETGIRHGTVTLLLHGAAYEITTFRTETGYSDHRHPDTVHFVGTLREDLSRRDFTVNAMAYHPAHGLVDLFGGQNDLSCGTVRCVGDADARFREDALRILRALRFAARYEWQLAPETAEAVRRNRRLLETVAHERVREELCGILTGQSAAEILRDFADVFCVILPELAPMIGLKQYNPYHCFDVWEHTLHAVEAVRPFLEAAEEEIAFLRLVLLLHDVGKPECLSFDCAGTGHFYGHAEAGAHRAEEALRRLRFASKTIADVTELVQRHDGEICFTDKSLRRWLNKIGETQLRRLLLVKRADVMAQSPARLAERIACLDATGKALDELLAALPCVSLQALCVNGDDLLALGLRSGPLLGKTLTHLLEKVLDGELPNEQAVLITEARRLAEIDGTPPAHVEKNDD